MDSAKAIRKALRIARADGGPVDAPPDRQLNPQGLYSAAAEAARALPQAKGQPQQMLASLKGVKPDELKWSGAQQAFAGQQTVTKDQLAQHFQNTLPPIQEEDGGGKFQRYSMTPNTYGGRGNLKGGYGTNYREKLLTLPDRVPDVPAFEDHPANAHFVAATNNARREAQDIWQMLPQGNRNENPNYRAAVERANLAHREERVAREQYSSNITKTLQEHRNFQSSHWDSPNVLAHLRMSDWQAPAGAARLPAPPKADTSASLKRNALENKIVPAWSTQAPGLVVNKELPGRRPTQRDGDYTLTHGASGLAIKRSIPFHHAQDLAARLGPLTDWTNPDGDVLKAQFRPAEKHAILMSHLNAPAPPAPPMIQPKTKRAEKNLLLDELQSDWGQKIHSLKKDERSTDALPEAPYVTKTEGWTDLGLKRALREAAQGGYHRLLWTPGEKQAKRYNLSNQVDHIQYNPVSKHFRAFKEGRNIVSKQLDSDEELPGLIGKEVANKLLQAPKSVTGIYHELKGTDMDIGGGGMKGFYDNIVPKRLLALAREHDPEAKLEHFQDKRKSSPINGFPSLPITEKMRESIMKRGFKAYARGGHVAPPDSAKAIRKALRIAGSTA